MDRIWKYSVQSQTTGLSRQVAKSPTVAINSCLGCQEKNKNKACICRTFPVFNFPQLNGFPEVNVIFCLKASVDFPPSVCPDFLSPCINYSIPKVLFLFPSVPGRTTSWCGFKLSSYCFIYCHPLLVSGRTVNNGSLDMVSRLPWFM